MSGIASTLRRRGLEIAWGAFALLNVVLLVTLGSWETIPFHFVWVSLTLVYGLRVWAPGTTALVMTAVCGASGGALLYAITRAPDGPGLDEMTEVPLMAAMFLAMVWHARRRQTALEEVRRLAESEHRMLESQREFVRDASHTLRTPITVARGHVELIRDATQDPQTRQDAEIVLDELGRLARLSERLLLLAASEHPGFLSVHPIDPRPFLEGIARRWTGAAPRDWQVDIAVDGTLQADGEQLSTAIDALIENAVKFTDVGDPIALRARSEHEALLIEVSDGGRGVAAEEIDRVFDPFMRSREAGTGGQRGTGLGLAIVKAIVEAHDGTVEVVSPAGVGATFVLRIPGLHPTPSFERVVEPARTSR